MSGNIQWVGSTPQATERRFHTFYLASTLDVDASEDDVDANPKMASTFNVDAMMASTSNVDAIGESDGVENERDSLTDLKNTTSERTKHVSREVPEFQFWVYVSN